MRFVRIGEAECVVVLLLLLSEVSGPISICVARRGSCMPMEGVLRVRDVGAGSEPANAIGEVFVLGEREDAHAFREERLFFLQV